MNTAAVSILPRTTAMHVVFPQAFVILVVLAAVPAFMLRPTGVMDDSVFWVVAKSLDGGRILYRDVFFTQPPLFIFIPQALWLLTSNIFLHRAFLVVIWILNGYLFSLALYRVERNLRWLAVGLFLVSAFVLQSYALHTEIFVLTAFLVAMLAVIRDWRAKELVVGLAASATLFIKLLGPLVFVPCLYYVLLVRRDSSHHHSSLPRRLALLMAGALIPAGVIGAYLAWQGTPLEFWQQVVLESGNLGLSLNADWIGYMTLAIAPLLVPVFVGLLLIDRRSEQLEWWVTAAVFAGLLGVELMRGARHYGLFNLCVLAWMAARAQDKLDLRNHVRMLGLGFLVALAAVFHIAAVREVLTRGLVTDELSAAQFVSSLPQGSLQVFGNNPPRIYMLLNELRPAYAYVFVYDTNRDLVNWDSYMSMIDKVPPDYIAVDDHFSAVEYGQLRSTNLTDATAVRTWIEEGGGYRQLDVGRSLGLTMYQRTLPIGGTESCAY
jgi:hypothetical protein